MRDWFDGYYKKFYGMYPQYRRYTPFYDDTADYNTNSKSYYDYLARFNKALLGYMTDLINRLLNRNIEVEDTNSIDLTKTSDWIDNGDCGKFDDVIKIKADVIISKMTETRKLVNTITKDFIIKNGSVIKNDGVWSPDYIDMINALDSEIGRIQSEITTIKQTLTDHNNRITKNKNDIDVIKNDLTALTTKVNNIEGGLQKILNNLSNSGAITNSNITQYTFKTGRNIATGNINLFGGTSDGNSFIRTSDNATNNDITAGY